MAGSRKVELLKEIRREYQFGTETIQGVAKRLKTLCGMMRQALASAIPPERKIRARSSPKLERVREFIEGILQGDREAPRKQSPRRTGSGSEFGRSIPTSAWWKRR